MLTGMIPTIFFNDLKDGLDLFALGLGFTVLEQGEDFAAVERDGAKAYVVQDASQVVKHPTELVIETDDVDAVLVDVKCRDMLRPNRRLVMVPERCRDVIVVDHTGVHIRFTQQPRAWAAFASTRSS